MQKRYNIKWRLEDEKEIRRVARNFNDKLRRLVKENPQNKNILPQFYNESTDSFESRITVASLKDLIKTRQDYNRLTNMLKRFSKRGAEEIIDIDVNEYGTKTTKWQKAEMSRMAGIVNRKRQERLDRLNIVEMASAQGELGYTLGEMFGMGLASRNKLNPTKAFTKAQSQTDLKYKQRALLQESRSTYHRDRDEILKENYIRTLLENYDPRDVREIASKIRNMEPELFLLKFEARGDKFEMLYSPSRGSEEYRNYLEEMRGYWLKNEAINQ